jgi:signal transduction histidine kinase
MRRPTNFLNSGSIRFRLFRLVVVVASAALVISMVGGALFHWSNQQKQVRQALETIARAAGVAASAAIAFNDTTAARDALRILAAQKEIEAAALYPLEGERLASYGDDAQLPDTVAALLAHPPAFSLFAPTTTIFQPVALDDATIGYILLRASLRDYRQSFLLQAALTIGVNLLGLLLVLLFGLRFLDGILKPVKELADTSRQVREDKNFARRAATPPAGMADDEISELIVNFNAMLAEIEQREQALSDYHKSLERKVLERTEALSAANRELEAAKVAAEAATLVKSRFLAAASHDLRQPILAINLFNDALHKTELTAEQQRISNFLSRSILSLGDLLDALLDITKLDAGAITPTPRRVGLHELFSSIEAEFATMATAKGLRFKLQFPFGDMALFTDAKLLQSLLRNLIGNAIKYTQRGGVLVAGRRRGDRVVIQVWDTGIGIATEHLCTIFDEYFQVANPERDKAKGLGLGLAIARRLAKLLATDIVCRSRLGRGSIFEFPLPLSAPAQARETDR